MMRIHALAAGMMALLAASAMAAEPATGTPSIVAPGGLAEMDVPSTATIETLNLPADGYRGIWYMNQPSNDEYVYKYSGGLGTYCAKHQPFAVYSPAVDKTFFCYGGAPTTDSRRLLHMVSYFDHKTGQVPRPTILLDKQTSDAHDNPVISLDDAGHIWIFSTSHGRGRPSFIHKSRRPYDVSEFERIAATHIEEGKEVPVDNFSYFQAWHVKDRGFICFFTKYAWPAARTSVVMTSPDGVKWSEWKRLAAIAMGHYQVSGVAPDGRAGTMMDYHPEGKGLNWRTNLYYLETSDNGESFHNAAGEPLDLPLTEVKNPALVHDYEAEGLLVYIKDLRFDAEGHPVLLYLTSKGYESGPENGPRTWMTARWTGAEWTLRPAFESFNNYDMGSLYIGEDGSWRIMAAGLLGPQPYNPGGEVGLWISKDQGANWELARTMTSGSKMNHTFVREPENAHPDFYAFWADGHGRQPSQSNFYFANKEGEVFKLPRQMEGEFATPEKLGAR